MQISNHGKLKEICSESMIDEASCVVILKACAKKKNLQEGTRLHADIVRRGLCEKSPYVGSALVNLYAKCGLLVDSQQVLEKLPLRDVVSWSALIAGFTQVGKFYEALICYERMQTDGISPNAVTFICLLKVCGTTTSINNGKRIHGEIVTRGLLEKDVLLGTTLVSMYAKCSMLAEAHQVLEELPARDIVSWSVLIAEYAQQRRYSDITDCFEQMKREGHFPDVVTFVVILKACSNLGALEYGKRIHAEIVARGLLEEDIALGTVLVDMYARCGMLAKAQEVLEQLPARNVISWSTIIAGYVEQGHGHLALNCFEQMQNEGIAPDAITWTSVLTACGSAGDIDEGMLVHSTILYRGLLEKDVVIGNALIDMYVKCGYLSEAHLVLNQLCTRDVVSWSTLIAGYAHRGHFCNALSCFEKMQNDEGLHPNAVTLIAILKACACKGEMKVGERIHKEIVSRGLLEDHIALGNALIDMYVKCGEIEKAQSVLEGLPGRNVVSWNAMIGGYAEHGQCHDAFKYFKRMKSEGLSPDEVTYISMLMACSGTRNIDRGNQIIEETLSRRLLGKNAMLGTALVDMYAKCGVIANAEQVLKGLLQDTASWNALIAGHVQHGQHCEALKCFEWMQNNGIFVNVVTYICILKACSSLGAFDKGEEIHVDVVNKGLLEEDIVIGGALVDMYARCGLLSRAQQVLDTLPVRNVVTWTALVAGCAEQGRYDEALNCLEMMQNEGITPNGVTFNCLLRLCNNSGMISDVSQNFAVHANREHGIAPNIRALTRAVEVHGCKGHFEKAVSMVKVMPYSDSLVWLGLLDACKKWGNMTLGKLAFDQAIQLTRSQLWCS